MVRSRPFSFTSVISKTGTSCLPLFQLVLSDPPCEEKEMCINYKDQYTNGWYIWFLLLIFLVALLCGVVFVCLQHWLRRSRIDSPRRTMAVFAVGDLDPVYEKELFSKREMREPLQDLFMATGTDMAVNPTVGIHLQTQNLELYPAPCFGTLGPPPPYEETLKSSRF